MKISLEWLKEIIDIHLSPSEISEKLAQLGFPVESITKIGTDINGVVSVRIESISKHPNNGCHRMKLSKQLSADQPQNTQLFV
jgi:phenylalanyl-tRNA synthetase beta chain